MYLLEPCSKPIWGFRFTRLIALLRAIPDSDISVGTNCVISNYMFISKIRHTSCPILIHQFSMIINQTMIELFDIRYAQNYIFFFYGYKLSLSARLISSGVVVFCPVDLSVHHEIDLLYINQYILKC